MCKDKNFKIFRVVRFDTHVEANRMARETFCRSHKRRDTDMLNVSKAFVM